MPHLKVGRVAFLLTEAVIAVFVLALVGLTMLGALPVQRRFETQRTERERLWSLCQAIGDGLRAKTLKLGDKEETVLWNGQSFQVGTSVSVVPQCPDRWLLRVSVAKGSTTVFSTWVVRVSQ